MISRPKAKTERIAFAPIDPPLYPKARANGPSVARQGAAKGRGWDRFSGRLRGLNENFPLPIRCVLVVVALSFSGFTIGQIGEMIGACPRSPAAGTP